MCGQWMLCDGLGMGGRVLNLVVGVAEIEDEDSRRMEME